MCCWRLDSDEERPATFAFLDLSSLASSGHHHWGQHLGPNTHLPQHLCPAAHTCLPPGVRNSLFSSPCCPCPSSNASLGAATHQCGCACAPSARWGQCTPSRRCRISACRWAVECPQGSAAPGLSRHSSPGAPKASPPRSHCPPSQASDHPVTAAGWLPHHCTSPP